jgi:predicted enzyme related to lactoylglutathione lyase
MAAIWVDTLVRFLHDDYRPPRTVKLTLTCGEETAGAFKGAENLAAEHIRAMVEADLRGWLPVMGVNLPEDKIQQMKQVEETALKVQYLEIVTPSVNETCDALAHAHGVVFSEPIAELGNARTADLEDGGRIGVRAPMRDTEEPVVRPYVLVDDIEAAVKAAETAGAKVALPPMEIPGQGTFSIYILGGIEHGLWQL